MKLNAECCIKLSYFRGLLKDKTSTISRVHRAKNSFILSSSIFAVNSDVAADVVAKVVLDVNVVNVVVIDVAAIVIVVDDSCTLKAIIERGKSFGGRRREREMKKTF